MLVPAGTASAAQPPWCGTPEADASLALDGFPHIPYYAIGCTLRDISARSHGQMQVQAIGKSATGRDLYGVVINRLRDARRTQGASTTGWTSATRRWRAPAKPSGRSTRLGDKVKIPIFVQGGIHGNEYEGVDAAIDVIERFATARPGTDPAVDRVLRHAILIFNPIQNPDGRVAGTRRNGNGFDLNRDYLTQSQSETRASIELMKTWLPPEVLDLHGYVSPTLIEATTKPHNPSIEYDLWLKWNQPRIDANEAAVNAIGRRSRGRSTTGARTAASRHPARLCPDGWPPGPAVAEGWDDWGPFYTADVRASISASTRRRSRCATRTNDDGLDQCGGRAGSRDVQIAFQTSTFDFVTDQPRGHAARRARDLPAR